MLREEFLLAGIPKEHGAARDAWILEAIRDGNFESSFAPVFSSVDGNEATFWIFRDALKIDGVRILVSARLAQQIADILDCSLLTPKLADLLFEQRGITLPPMPRQPVVADTKTMIAQSQKIDEAIERAGGDDGTSIIQTVGKHWVLVNKLKGTSKAANYGWHFLGNSFGGQKFEPTVSLPGVRVIQGVGTRHDSSHVDYSQNLVLVSNEVDVNGYRMRLQDVLQDPEYAKLASHEGVLTVLRQPGVAKDAFGSSSGGGSGSSSGGGSGSSSGGGSGSSSGGGFGSSSGGGSGSSSGGDPWDSPESKESSEDEESSVPWMGIFVGSAVFLGTLGWILLSEEKLSTKVGNAA